MRLLVFFICVIGFVAAMSQDQIRATALCGICKLLMGQVEQDIEQNGEASVKDAANKACDKLFLNNPIMDPLCQTIVDYEIDKVEDDIKKKEDPAQICQKLELC